MISKECRLVRREIDELELGERTTERTSAHLAVCIACREFRAERTEMRRLVGSFGPVVAPPDFEMRLRARIAREESDTRSQPLFARLIRTPALAAAALFVVVGGTVVWVAQRNDDSSKPVATVQPAAQLPSKAIDATPQPNADDSVVTDEASGVKPDQLAAVTPVRRKPETHAPRSQDFEVRGTPPIGPGDQAFVNAPSKPVVFALEDERGKKRQISLPPVSFGGAQTLVDNRVPVSYTGNSRVW